MDLIKINKTDITHVINHIVDHHEPVVDHVTLVDDTLNPILTHMDVVTNVLDNIDHEENLYLIGEKDCHVWNDDGVVFVLINWYNLYTIFVDKVQKIIEMNIYEKILL